MERIFSTDRYNSNIFIYKKITIQPDNTQKTRRDETLSRVANFEWKPYYSTTKKLPTTTRVRII